MDQTTAGGEAGRSGGESVEVVVGAAVVVVVVVVVVGGGGGRTTGQQTVLHTELAGTMKHIERQLRPQHVWVQNLLAGTGVHVLKVLPQIGGLTMSGSLTSS